MSLDSTSHLAYRRLFPRLALILILQGCAPAIAPYSDLAYQKAVDLKVDSLRLMDRAEASYTDSSKRVDDLMLRLEKAYEFNFGRPRNNESTQQWAILIDPDRNLLGGFLARWEDQDHLSRTFVVESKRIVASAFDSIIQLESGKLGSGDSDQGGS